MGKVIDTLTGKEFDSMQEYLEHTSPVTGYKPTDPRHHGSRFLRQSKEALRRTGKLTKTREKEIDDQIAEIKEKGVDRNIMRARQKKK